MVNVLPQIQRQPSFKEQLGSSLGQTAGATLSSAFQGMSERARMKKENEALKGLGIDVTGIRDPDLRKEIVKAGVKQKADQHEQFETGIETLDKMEEILSKGNLGRGSALFGIFGGETAQDRSEYEQLGKSLIPLVAAGVPIRNQREFEEYKKTLTNPSALQSEIKGALDGLRDIFERKLSGESEKKEKKSKKKIKFDISKPGHKARRDEILKQAKGDQAKAKRILDEEFEE